MMSFTINSTEEVRICGACGGTRGAARALEKYLRQFDRLDGIQRGSVRLRLAADDRVLRTRARIDPRHPDAPLLTNDPEAGALLDRLDGASDIEMKLSYDIMQTCEALYGAAYWEQALRDGPVEGVSCRLMFRNVDDGPEYYCLGLSGDTVGLVPFDASEKDVARVKLWHTDALLVSMDIASPDAGIGADALRPLAEAFAETYGTRIGYLAEDSFLISDGTDLPADRIPALLADLQRLRDYAAGRGLTRRVEAYLYADGAFALAHISEARDGKIRIEYCKM